MEKLHKEKKSYSFKELTEIIAELRSAERGCPWDKVQTHESLIPCLRDESEEVVEAIEKKDLENLCEELGDVLLQVMLHSQIARENNEFTIDDVINGLCEKMIRRHPHVFAGTGSLSINDSLIQWEQIKKQEKEEKSLTK